MNLFVRRRELPVTSFRRHGDEWDDFLKRHGHVLRECGIPDEIAANKRRFLIFLDHGYDEWGWAEGWVPVKFKGSRRPFKHPDRPGRVTVSGKPSHTVPLGTLKSIFPQAGWDE